MTSTDRTAEPPAVPAPARPAGAGEPGLTVPPAVAPGPGSPPTPAAVSKRGAAAGPDPISRWGGEGGPDPGKGGPPEHRCTCGHLDVFHNYGKRSGVQVRTGCSVSDGAKAVPCGCPLYEEAS